MTPFQEEILPIAGRRDPAAVDRELKAIRAMAPDAVKQAPEAVSAYAQQAQNLYARAKTDRDLLVSAGLDWTLVESVPVRVLILRHAESIWRMRAIIDTGISKQREVDERAARALRKQLQAGLRFAFRKSPDLLAGLARIRKGNSRRSLARSLKELAALAREQPALVTPGGIDEGKLEAVMCASRNLDGLAPSRPDSGSWMSPREFRDRAFAHVRNGVEEVRLCALYVFANNPARLKGYKPAATGTGRHRRNARPGQDSGNSDTAGVIPSRRL